MAVPCCADNLNTLTALISCGEEASVKDNGQRYRVGSWTVSPRQVEAFIEAWQEFTEWVLEQLPEGGEAFLLHDLDEPENNVNHVIEPER